MVVPIPAFQGGLAATDVDSLAKTTGGIISEEIIAQNGAKPGDRVGDRVWTLGEISPVGDNNINDVVTQIGFGAGDIDDHTAYALITIVSPRARNNAIVRVGSDDSIKVWLNGEEVWRIAKNRPAGGFLEEFQVDLKAGDNLLLVKVSERARNWSMFVGLQASFTAAGKAYESSPRPGDKVTGPWLWMIAPSAECDDVEVETDWLARASDGEVTEEQIAKRGAKARTKVGEFTWTQAEIEAVGENNVNAVINEVKFLRKPDINENTAYAYINVVSPSDFWLGFCRTVNLPVWGAILHFGRPEMRNVS
jgi:hypothetical protein